MIVEINKTDGKWLINGMPYDNIGEEEKQFFDEFIIARKMEYECEQHDKLNNNKN